MPSFTRKGLPVARDFSSLARRSASRMISAEPFFRYVSCSSTGAKVDMRKAIIRNEAPKAESRRLECLEFADARPNEHSHKKSDPGRYSTPARGNRSLGARPAVRGLLAGPD